MQTKALLSEQHVSQMLSAAKDLAHRRNWPVAICVGCRTGPSSG
ncbi:hypothetical protein EMIT0P294_30763 [Pseudomonas sp. IT-P294]|jgi:uncharacterized protein GlcG (DUF336 family)